MNKHRLWLPLIILIAFALRLTLLGQQSLWYDESVTWLLSQMQLPDLIQWTAADIQPPLYYLLIWTSDILINESEWALRFPSALFNTLTVPLIFVLARRLFPKQPSTTPLLAALIFALSPLMVYYSQEARMYTMLTCEATLASYLLLRILYPSPSPRRWRDSPLPVGEGLGVRANFAPPPSTVYRLPSTVYRLLPTAYALTATAALYTHYFAAFLLIAHALFMAVTLWQRGWPKPLRLQTLQMFGLTALLFAPWLPTLLSRLGDDPSYWPGALKLDEALRKVLISFIVGETVFEQTGLILALVTLGLFGVGGLIAIGQRHRRQAATQPLPAPLLPRSPAPPLHPSPRTSALFLLLWLGLPLLLILGLSYQSPKFNPRYTLLAYPAFCLLLTAAIAYFYSEMPYALRTRQSTVRAAYYVFHSVPMLFLFAISVFSLSNWFTQRDFQKDDFRATAQFVRERMAADETVLLSSGHLFPVWAYYFGWDNWTPLPWMQRLDVNRVTGLDIAAEIAPAVEGKDGVWLVTWQDEVIDPNGVVPFWLDRIGRRPIDAGDFWGVGLEHWRLDPDKVALLAEDPIDQPARFNFADQVELVGSTQLNNTDLALFWRPHQPLPDDLILTLDLTDAEGYDWDRETTIGRPGAYFYPPSRWPVGEIVMTRYTLPWQIGTPPGLYTAEIGLGQAGSTAINGAASANEIPEFQGWDILDEQGRPQRRTALIDFINVSHLVQPAGDPLPIAADPQIDFLPIVAIRRSILLTDSAEPGERILLALLWQAGKFNLDDISVAFDLIDAEGQTYRVGSSLTPSRHYNLPRWEPGEVVLGQYWLDIPPQAAPGPAQLQIHLVNSSGFTYDEVFPLDEIDIRPSERNFNPPTRLDHRLEARFGEQITLLGLECAAGCRAKPGEIISLTLHWRAEATPDKSYTVFTHLLDATETVLVNADHAPPKPSQGWLPGEIITDPVNLTLPADLAPGDYALEIGLYDAANPAFPRLPLDSGDTRVLLADFVAVD